jgi:hypothetical protein
MSDVPSRQRGDDRFRNDPRFSRGRDSQGNFWNRGEDDRVLSSPDQQFETSAPYRQPQDDSNQERGGHSGRGPKGYVRTDERILEEVCDRLSASDDVDATEITVLVSGGEVTLEGRVETRHMKRLAAELAESVSGVVDVHNTIRTQKPLLTEVKDKLRREEDAPHAGKRTEASSRS